MSFPTTQDLKEPAQSSLLASSADLLEWLKIQIAQCELTEQEAHRANQYQLAMHQRTLADAYRKVIRFLQRGTDAARALMRQTEDNKKG